MHPSLANFILVDFPNEPGRDATAACAFLDAEGILVRQVGAYGLPDSLRITIGLEEDNRRVAAALAAFVGACDGDLTAGEIIGAIAVLTAIGIQRLQDRRPAPRAVVIGIRQTLLGLGVVVATALGVLWT